MNNGRPPAGHLLSDVVLLQRHVGARRLVVDVVNPELDAERDDVEATLVHLRNARHIGGQPGRAGGAGAEDTATRKHSQ